MVGISRRDFLKLSGGVAGGVALLGVLPKDAALAAAHKTIPLKRRIGETTTICCYCAVGCGAIVAADPGRVVDIEGDPDHPINQGTLCSKGQALAQFRTVDGQDNPRRLTTPQVRRPGKDGWDDISWDDALNEIAQKIKDTRDNNWTEVGAAGEDDAGYLVRRTDAIANFGGGELDNEECYLLAKMCRALGLVYLEHCARI